MEKAERRNKGKKEKKDRGWGGSRNGLEASYCAYGQTCAVRHLTLKRLLAYQGCSGRD